MNAEQPWLIPYVEHHQGPRRVLTLQLTTGNSMVASKYRPIVSIDGRQYVVLWGPVHFEVPADRNVHVSVHLEGDLVSQVASMLVGPGEANLAFRYETHYSSSAGSLTPEPTPG